MRSTFWIDGRACVHIECGRGRRGRGRDVRRQSGKQHCTGGLDAAPRRDYADGRLGRNRYGDLQLVVRRGTQATHRRPTLFRKRFFSLTGFFSHQLDLKNGLDIRAPSLHTGARTWVTDYLVGCHASEESGLSVLVGSNEHVSPFCQSSSVLMLLP